MASRVPRSALLSGDSDRTLLGRWAYAAALLAVIVATLLFLPFRDLIVPGPWPWGYLLIVGAVASLGGVGPALVAAFASFLAENFFFLQPYGSLTVHGSEAVVQLVAFLVVAIAWGWQAGRLREREVAAIRNQAEADFLLELSNRVGNEPTLESMVEFATGELSRLFAATRVVVWRSVPMRQPEPIARAGFGVAPEDASALEPVIEWVIEKGRPLGLNPQAESVSPALTSKTADDVFLPLRTTEGVQGVLELGWPSGQRPTLGARPTRLLTSFADMIATFLLNRRMADERAHVEAAAEADRLKTALLSSVSHELKTPLASVTAAVTDIASRPEGTLSEAEVREQMNLATDDLRRLEQAIADLLDISRLEAGQWAPRPDVYEAGEIIADVVSREPRWARNHIVYDLPDPGPTVYTDFTQLSRALRNLVDNALAYGLVGEPVVIGASESGGGTAVWVADHGPGVPDAEKPVVFDKFFRGVSGHSRPGSTGLGLSVAKEIVLANGGTVWVEDAEGGGARFVIYLPAEGPNTAEAKEPA